tara:strand:- start:2599 stop:2766 length:168 start_codon:yes stop_codon:yes gene_type:complete
MKQVRLLDSVHLMLEEVVKREINNGNLGANKQSVVNELIIAKYKKVNKNAMLLDS